MREACGGRAVAPRGRRNPPPSPRPSAIPQAGFLLGEVGAILPLRVCALGKNDHKLGEVVLPAKVRLVLGRKYDGSLAMHDFHRRLDEGIHAPLGEDEAARFGLAVLAISPGLAVVANWYWGHGVG